MTSADNKNHDFTASAAPYQALAPIYDQLMEHVNYARWADFIAQLLKNYTAGKRIIELACGTGIMAEKLAEYGYTVDGFDRSAEMIEIAKNRRNHPQLNFQTASFLDFPIKGRYDGAVCLYDSINYLMNLSEVISFIQRVKQALKHEGAFIFDICTRYNSFINFQAFVDEGVIEGFYYHRYSNYDPGTHIHINNFMIYPAGNPQAIVKEHHQQFIYSVRQIQSAIKKSGMKLEAKFDNITPAPPRLKSLRIHFLSRKV